MKQKFALLATAAALSITGLCTSCSGASPSVAGNWMAPDGSSAFISQDGTCSGMYWQNGKLLDIGGPETCSYSENTLTVTQPPNKITYSVRFSGDTMTLIAGTETLTFTRQ